MVAFVVLMLGGMAFDDYQKHNSFDNLVKSGVDPIKARCAVYGKECDKVKP